MQKKIIWIIMGVLFFAFLIFLSWNLVRNILGPTCEGANCRLEHNILEMSDEELKDCFEVDLFERDQKRLNICPKDNVISLKSREEGAIAFGIRNLINETGNFSYEITSQDSEIEALCGIAEKESINLISANNSKSNIVLEPNEIYIQKIIFSSKEYPYCTTRYKIQIYSEGEIYAARYFYVRFN